MTPHPYTTFSQLPGYLSYLLAFEQMGHGSFFRENWGWLQMWFGTFTRGSTASRGRVVSTCHLWSTHLQHPAQVPCEFQADWTRFHFSGKIEGGSRHDLTHLPMAALLQSGGWYPLAIFRGDCPYHGAGPLWVSSRLDQVHFLGKIEGTFTWGSTSSRGMEVWTCCLQGRLPLPWGRSPVSFKQMGHGSFFKENWGWLRTWFGTFTWDSTASRGTEARTCHLQGRLPSPWGRSPVSFEWICHGSFFRENWGWLWTWSGTFTQGSTASRGMEVWTCCLQGRFIAHDFRKFYNSIYLCATLVWTFGRFFQLFNAADWCKELTIFTGIDYFSIPSISSSGTLKSTCQYVSMHIVWCWRCWDT